jgi:hypothetical protein
MLLHFVLDLPMLIRMSVVSAVVVPLIVTAMYITTDAKLQRYFLFQWSAAARI